MSHPYKGLPPHQFWPAGMTAPAPGLVNPAQPLSLPIERQHRVATMGSCFAQHLAREIREAGFSYLVTEPAPEGLDAQAALASHYGTFSARYGNVYTVRQALQLFDRAYGRFAPVEDSWAHGEHWVDPYRPTIQPGGFATREALFAERDAHLACVRRVFEEAEWFIFTLGLTEAWRSRRDGAVFPLAPGVSGGHFDPELHEFVNFGASEVTADLANLRQRLQQVNPGVRLLLTVSPVPLAATYEPRHVWTATTYSKAVLRVAAEETVRRFDDVFYFPSYEIITSPAAGARYYDDDLRSVTRHGVNHVMRVFFAACGVEALESASVDREHVAGDLAADMQMPCEERLLLPKAPTGVAAATQTVEGSQAMEEVVEEAFDEAAYLHLYPDVAKAVTEQYFTSGWDHYQSYGRQEGRKPK